MANVLSEDKKQQVIALGRLGWSLRRIERETGIRRETAGLYLRVAGVAVRPSGWGRKLPAKPAIEVTTDSGPEKATISVPAGADPAKPAMQVTTDSEAVSSGEQALETGSKCAIRPQQSPSASACEPYRELIELDLGRGRNAVAIWQDLVSFHGFARGYQNVKRFVHRLRGTQTAAARVVIVTAPGEESQVDYGTGPMVRDPLSGKYRRTRLFVMTLAYSRKAVRLLTFRSTSRIWAELHEQAFRRLGGATRVVVLDNLREGVLVPDVYDPTLNPLYRDVLAHYGAVAMPCRVRDADRKGKVESAVGHAQKTPLKGLRFESLEEAQAYLDHWEQHWADTRIHGTTKRQVAAMFSEERPALLPLPVEPFRYYQFGERTVHLDGCVEVESAYYGAPPGWIGRQVKVQWNQVYIRLLDPKTGQLLREHFRQKPGRHAIQERDRPKRTPLRTHQLLWRAEKAGAHIGQLCHRLYDRQGELAIRRILGVLALAKKHGLSAVEEACATALEMGVPDYRFVRRYLEKNPQLPLSLRQIDPLIRELVQYRELIEQRTKEMES
jgi:transposase